LCIFVVMTTSLSDVESVVRRYYAVVADLASSEESLAPLLADHITVREHPNALNREGAVRDRAGTLAGFRAGKRLLREQQFAVHEVLVNDRRAAVRASWRGVVGVDAGPFAAGQVLTAQVAALLTVEEGQIASHETFDCYDPFETRGEMQA
jgi:ketosteroid isomerase-like protein